MLVFIYIFLMVSSYCKMSYNNIDKSIVKGAMHMKAKIESESFNILLYFTILVFFIKQIFSLVKIEFYFISYTPFTDIIGLISMTILIPLILTVFYFLPTLCIMKVVLSVNFSFNFVPLVYSVSIHIDKKVFYIKNNTYRLLKVFRC